MASCRFDLDPRIQLCALGDQLLAFHQASGDTHLLEGVAAELVNRLAEAPLTREALEQLDSTDLQISLSRLMMELDHLGIVRARECE
ncbi:HPr-rel-A system PqqD family peptide chaperone [Aestuariirhabdus litorea]|uniref:HPr-rel-A system PqqD family peptide chaperone n=1 Tax=Aestuariirhabdus litorea TaxID=2528527 RepID=UPI001FB2539C|nr:HPr-rel-A system PqqD family peptide chaperone [Aestuariirhabdus litorea]